MVDLASYLDGKRQLIDSELDLSLPPESVRPEVLHRAMRYAVFAGGKRLRPILCLAAAESIDPTNTTALCPSIAIELLHTASLIHDDLPLLDDDPFRRGKPSCHLVFGAANALLAGDALVVGALAALAAVGRAVHAVLARVA